MSAPVPKRFTFSRLLREPTLHFFAVAVLVLAGHRALAGNPRSIVLTPALKADVLRRYHDQMNRPLTSAETETVLEAWKVDEALYREALREGLERDDPTVRNVLIGKMRDRALLATRTPEPTEAELQQYLAQHRADFEAPLLYEHEYVVFPKSQPTAAEQRTKAEARLAEGATPASLGLRSTAANVDRARIEREFGPEVADAIVHLPFGAWHELETVDRLLLVKMSAVTGGLPPPETLHAQLVAGWKGEQAQRAVDRATRAIADRYRFEESSR